ncbi:MAG TPA: hypothetical protein VFB27_01405, partial [Opitutaceae bacterium]|nr:hypothetical protein [Opitutaceae bacterium]
MPPDVSWLVRLCIDQGLITSAQAAQIRSALGETAGLMDFAQKLIDDAVVNDVALLEKIANEAFAKGQEGPPGDDPFAGPGRAPATAAAGAAEVQFPFDRLASLDDAALAAALRELLRTVAQSGASDLHLSTGARPFIRKNRALSFLSDHPLTADEALRLNTILLSAGQRQIFFERLDYDYALATSGSDRYRVNLMLHKQGSAGAYRMVPARVRSLAELGFATHLETLKRLLSYHNG